MLTGYTICILLKSISPKEVVQAYIDNIYTKIGGTVYILSDNSTELKKWFFLPMFLQK